MEENRRYAKNDCAGTLTLKTLPLSSGSATLYEVLPCLLFDQHETDAVSQL